MVTDGRTWVGVEMLSHLIKYCVKDPSVVKLKQKNLNLRVTINTLKISVKYVSSINCLSLSASDMRSS